MNYSKLFLFISLAQSIASYAMDEQTKQQVTAFIKHDIYRYYVQEMAFAPTENKFTGLVKGNTDLEKDLNNLYFGKGGPLTQSKLNSFCKKWQLTTINIK